MLGCRRPHPQFGSTERRFRLIYPSLKAINLDLLTVREREVVAMAVDGRTDEQIAQALGIRPGTVNTYWVRVRLKVGPLSRTEIVAGVLRHEMEERCDALRRELAELTAAQQKRQAPEADADEAEPWRYLSLGYLFDAALVMDHQGMIVYANPHARTLLRADRHELEGLPFWEIVAPDDRSGCKERIRQFFANGNDRRVVVGLDTPYYGLRRDGTRVRLSVAAEWFESPDGVIASVSLREYLKDSPGHAPLL